MADVKKIATRESYGNALVELGAEYPNLLVLDADLAAATKTGIFKNAFDRMEQYNCRIGGQASRKYRQRNLESDVFHKKTS